jgi:hypothetical protein
MSHAFLDRFEIEGWAVVPGLLDPAGIDVLLRELDDVAPRGPGRAGARDLLERSPAVRRLCSEGAAGSAAEAVLGPSCFAVQGLLFDKSAEVNWAVGRHQDGTIAVRRRADAPGFLGWRERDGAVTVQAPAAVLAGILTIRLHLDPCGEEQGALRVISGSHRWGRVPGEELGARCAGFEERSCPVDRGGALLMRPLLVHASSRIRGPGRRRVLHLEFASTGLPHGLEWRYEVPHQG